MYLSFNDLWPPRFSRSPLLQDSSCWDGMAWRLSIRRLSRTHESTYKRPIIHILALSHHLPTSLITSSFPSRCTVVRICPSNRAARNQMPLDLYPPFSFCSLLDPLSYRRSLVRWVWAKWRGSLRSEENSCRLRDLGWTLEKSARFGLQAVSSILHPEADLPLSFRISVISKARALSANIPLRYKEHSWRLQDIREPKVTDSFLHSPTPRPSGDSSAAPSSASFRSVGFVPETFAVPNHGVCVGTLTNPGLGWTRVLCNVIP